MNERDRLAEHAPVTYEMALAVYGGDAPNWDDATLRCFMAVWVYLRYEYADAMLEARRQNSALDTQPPAG